MKRSTAKTLYLVLGILLVIGAALFGLATIAFVTSPPGTYAPDVQIFAGVCAGIQAIPAVIFLYLWRTTSLRVREIDTLAAILRTVRDVSLDDLAKQLHKMPQELELMISQAIAEGTVHGYVDGRERKFVAGGWAGMGAPPMMPVIQPAPAVPAVPVFPPPAATGAPEVRYCRECGSVAERIPGRNTWRCPSCGNIQ